MDLANFELKAEVCLQDSMVQSFNELVELIADRVVSDVAGPFVQSAAEAVTAPGLERSSRT